MVNLSKLRLNGEDHHGSDASRPRVSHCRPNCRDVRRLVEQVTADARKEIAQAAADARKVGREIAEEMLAEFARAADRQSHGHLATTSFPQRGRFVDSAARVDTFYGEAADTAANDLLALSLLPIRDCGSACKESRGFTLTCWMAPFADRLRINGEFILKPSRMQ
jgi:hypothetical protein